MQLQLPRSISSSHRLPHVLVVVPCYNYGRFLGACVDSILSQPGVTTDILIIDDASTDDSVAVASQLAERHRAVRIVVHEQNRGHIATYNEGLATADSDYVVLLSADDVLAPGALKRATGLMEMNTAVGLVYGNPQNFVDTPRPSPNRFSTWSVWKGERWLAAQFERGLGIIYSPEAVVRTSVHHAAGYYRPELPHSGDLELWLRIAAIADVGRVNGPDQAFRRVHPASMMQTQFNTVIDDLLHREMAYESFLTTAGVGLRNVVELRGTVHRRMSQEALSWACTVLAENRDRSVQRADLLDVSRAVEFAKEIFPDYQTLRVWREFRRHSDDSTSLGITSRVLGRADALSRDFSQRVHWRRWRYFGV